MDSTPIYQYAKPTSASLMPPESSDAIITPGYELRLYLIKLIRDKSFLGEGHENCACLHITGMSDKTLIWKLFPFSLMGRAKQWYSQTIGSMQGDWEMLCSKFVYVSFPSLKWLAFEKRF